MIDFRYHLVSIASVFLALAVGIVLGAGPLKGTLGDTLASEVSQLRENADSLRDELAGAQAGVSARDDVITALRPRSTSGLLAGSTVSILALPNSPEPAVETARSALVESGASVAAQVRLEASWTSEDPPDVTDRTAAAAELRELLSGDLPVGIAPERVIALALGWALATDPTAGAGGEDPTAGAEDGTTGTATAAAAGTPTDLSTGPPLGSADETGVPEEPELVPADGTSARILEILAANGLLTIEGEDAPALTDGVVIVTAATAEAGAAPVTDWIDLAGAIDEAGAVVVSGGLEGEPAAETDVIEAIRNSSDLSDRISTLDNLTGPMGGAALPFVVAEQLAGRAGHYGELGSAAELFPALPTNDNP